LALKANGFAIEAKCHLRTLTVPTTNVEYVGAVAKVDLEDDHFPS
jgi:hypothetical protein